MMSIWDANAKDNRRAQLAINQAITAQDVPTLKTGLSRLRKILGTKALDEEMKGLLSSLATEKDEVYRKKIKKFADYLAEVGYMDAGSTAFSDIALSRWKEYPEILTDSLWFFDRRDKSGAHVLNKYHGNFVPQIPRQLILRFTKKYEWVLDPMVGEGTTLIEAQRQGRNAIGVELQESAGMEAMKAVHVEPNPHRVCCETVIDDSTTYDYTDSMILRGIKKFSLAILHPPYFNAIRFSNNPKDLSNATSLTAFLDMLMKVVGRVHQVLAEGRYMALVMGDLYSKGEWIPLGYMCMQRILDTGGFKLKSIIVKNYGETTAKKGQKPLWRYQALKGGFYNFSHETLFLFVKKA